jgi:hypothetical protein
MYVSCWAPRREVVNKSYAIPIATPVPVKIKFITACLY